MLTVLEFHNISTKGVVLTNLPAARFARVLDLLLKETHVIAPSDFHRILESSEDGYPHVMLSFDDGYEEIYTRAYPIMRERGVQGMVSIVAGYVGKFNKWDIMGGNLRHLGWEQIEHLLTEGWYITSHTMTHPDLKRCTDDRLDWEFIESRKLLEHRLKRDIPAIAYPFGRFNSRVLAAANRAGYQIGFTVGAEVWRKERGPLTTIRVPVYEIDTNAMILAKVKPDGFWKRIDTLKNRTFNRTSLVTSFLRRNSYKGIPIHP